MYLKQGKYMTKLRAEYEEVQEKLKDYKEKMNKCIFNSQNS